MQVILGGLTQRIEGARGWDYVDHHWQRPIASFCPPFEKHSPSSCYAVCKIWQETYLAFDPVVKARRPMSSCALHSHSFSGCLCLPHGLYACEM
jgi:hypothetical protein